MDHKRIAIKLEAKIIPPFLSKLEKELSRCIEKTKEDKKRRSLEKESAINSQKMRRKQKRKK